ncbi:MAG: hypothetical protein ABJ360_10330 [Roseobacter sp.]|uniref:hypothetical protein n=1 Tax=Alphaproteobacteria TaxID=28211 RepID=UPI003263121D
MSRHLAIADIGKISPGGSTGTNGCALLNLVAKVHGLNSAGPANWIHVAPWHPGDT